MLMVDPGLLCFLPARRGSSLALLLGDQVERDSQGRGGSALAVPAQGFAQDIDGATELECEAGGDRGIGGHDARGGLGSMIRREDFSETAIVKSAAGYRELQREGFDDEAFTRAAVRQTFAGAQAHCAASAFIGASSPWQSHRS